MNEDLVSAATTIPTPEKGNQAGTQTPSTAAKPSLFQMIDWLKLGGLAYAAGFAVIMVHTARLDVPVVEAFEFQNIVAGLPVLLLLGIAIWSTPRLIRPLMSRDTPKLNISNKTFVVMVFLLALAIGGIYFELQAVLNWHPSASGSWVAISALVFISSLSMLAQTYDQQVRDRLHSVLSLTTALSGIILLLLGYAILAFPRLPQSVGGARPVRIKLYFKEPSLTSVLGRSTMPGDPPNASAPLTLYYRTSSYLLLAGPQSHSLIQFPTDQVLAVVWLDSHAQ